MSAEHDAPTVAAFERVVTCLSDKLAAEREQAKRLVRSVLEQQDAIKQALEALEERDTRITILQQAWVLENQQLNIEIAKRKELHKKLMDQRSKARGKK